MKCEHCLGPLFVGSGGSFSKTSLLGKVQIVVTTFVGAIIDTISDDFHGPPIVQRLQRLRNG